MRIGTAFALPPARHRNVANLAWFFGVPDMLNPIFFIPVVLSAIVPGIIGMALCSFLPIAFNPTIAMGPHL